MTHEDIHTDPWQFIVAPDWNDVEQWSNNNYYLSIETGWNNIRIMFVVDKQSLILIFM